jgi:hypothetical protein
MSKKFNPCEHSSGIIDHRFELFSTHHSVKVFQILQKCEIQLRLSHGTFLLLILNSLSSITSQISIVLRHYERACSNKCPQTGESEETVS